MTTYTNINFTSKKKFREHIENGGKVQLIDVNQIQPKDYSNFTGRIFDLCGPHFPHSHTWFARIELKDGLIIKIDDKEIKKNNV